MVISDELCHELNWHYEPDDLKILAGAFEDMSQKHYTSLPSKMNCDWSAVDLFGGLVANPNMS